MQQCLTTTKVIKVCGVLVQTIPSKHRYSWCKINPFPWIAYNTIVLCRKTYNVHHDMYMDNFIMWISKYGTNHFDSFSDEKLIHSFMVILKYWNSCLIPNNFLPIFLKIWNIYHLSIDMDTSEIQVPTYLRILSLITVSSKSLIKKFGSLKTIGMFLF